MADRSVSVTISVWVEPDPETMCDVCWRTGYVTVTWAHITTQGVRSERRTFCALCRREQTSSDRGTT